jgi:hypothetical protein
MGAAPHVTLPLLDGPVTYCGRIFTPEEMAAMRRLIADPRDLSRAALSREVCRLFDWRKPDGGLKDMSCRVAMLRMHRDGLIRLPAPRKPAPNGRTRPKLTSRSEAQMPVTESAGRLGELKFVAAGNKEEPSRLWNELIERHHYLGYQPLPGAQIRYVVYSRDGRLLAALGFGAAAWKAAPRDTFIGWTHQQRKQNLHLVVNNARFLILPWVTSKNLASRILSGTARFLGDHWQQRYGYRPVLLETFVETGRFQGTCYKAANWTKVGRTQGRGKLDVHYKYALPVKDIYVLPLQKHFRRGLCAGQ